MLQTPDRNTKVLLDLADHMEHVDPKRYKQEIYNDGCGNGCIAFHATEMLGVVIAFNEVAARLGIARQQADKLFNPDAGITTVMGLAYRGPTPKTAASAIRHLAVTGEVPVNWTEHIQREPVTA